MQNQQNDYMIEYPDKIIVPRRQGIEIDSVLGHRYMRSDQAFLRQEPYVDREVQDIETAQSPVPIDSLYKFNERMWGADGYLVLKQRSFDYSHMDYV